MKKQRERQEIKRAIIKTMRETKVDIVNMTRRRILESDVGRTILHMVTLDGATIEGARGIIDVMIRALEVGRVSKLSSTFDL